MAITQFPNILIVKKFDTSENIEIGQFKPTKHGELKYARTRFLVRGNIVGTERVRMKVHLTSDLTVAYATSTWVNVSTFDTSSGSNDMLSWVRFDFNREPLNKNQSYYFSIESGNYTRNADTFYLGLTYDYPASTYTDDLDYSKVPLSLQVFTYQEG